MCCVHYSYKASSTTEPNTVKFPVYVSDSEMCLIHLVKYVWLSCLLHWNWPVGFYSYTSVTSPNSLQTNSKPTWFLAIVRKIIICSVCSQYGVGHTGRWWMKWSATVQYCMNKCSSHLTLMALTPNFELLLWSCWKHYQPGKDGHHSFHGTWREKKHMNFRLLVDNIV